LRAGLYGIGIGRSTFNRLLVRRGIIKLQSRIAPACIEIQVPICLYAASKVGYFPTKLGNQNLD